MSDITLSEILGKSGNTEEQYDNALEFVEKQVPIVYKGKSYEVNIGPFNTVILKLLKSNLSMQYVAVYVMLT